MKPAYFIVVDYDNKMDVVFYTDEEWEASLYVEDHPGELHVYELKDFC